MRFIYFKRDSEAEEDLPPELKQIALQKYHKAWDSYVDAGCPFGETDSAMLIWFEFDQKTREN